MKTVLVTGSTGFLGSKLVSFLSSKKEYMVIGAVENPDGFTDKYCCNEFLSTISNDILIKNGIEGVDVVVNCAFARSSDPFLLANALDFTEILTQSIKMSNISSFINISSQGVYKRLPASELQTEETDIEPIDCYSMAKYAAEKIILSSKCVPYITNVRLASVNMKQRFLYSFVKKVFLGEKIILTAPNQYAALLDIKDAISGIKALIDLPDDMRRTIYNLGIGSQMTISDYAQITIKTMKKYGYDGIVEYRHENTEISNSGMDCSRIMKDTGWLPKVTVVDMIESFYLELISRSHYNE